MTLPNSWCGQTVGSSVSCLPLTTSRASQCYSAIGASCRLVSHFVDATRFQKFLTYIKYNTWSVQGSKEGRGGREGEGRWRRENTKVYGNGGECTHSPPLALLTSPLLTWQVVLVSPHTYKVHCQVGAWLFKECAMQKGKEYKKVVGSQTTNYRQVQEQ